MTVSVRSIEGADIVPLLDELARLRIKVFADFPYLYDGDLDYEAQYLREYARAPNSVLVVAVDGSNVVGAATAAPMQHQKAEFRAPFEAIGLDTDRLFYFGESVLLSEYRGQGIGHAFFDQREAHAMRCGAVSACFAAVIRADDHPGRPRNYRPLDDFWTKRGYSVVSGLQTSLCWRDVGAADETEKLMQYWLRQW